MPEIVRRKGGLRSRRWREKVIILGQERPTCEGSHMGRISLAVKEE